MAVFADPTTDTPPDRLWVRNAHSTDPAKWVLVAGVPHSHTDGVVVWGKDRLDPLDRERAACLLAVADPALEPALARAAAEGPAPAPPVAVPSTTLRALDAIARMGDCRFHSSHAHRNFPNRCPDCGWPNGGFVSLAVWKPLPSDAWERRAETKLEPELEAPSSWTPAAIGG